MLVSLLLLLQLHGHRKQSNYRLTDCMALDPNRNSVLFITPSSAGKDSFVILWLRPGSDTDSESTSKR